MTKKFMVREKVVYIRSYVVDADDEEQAIDDYAYATDFEDEIEYEEFLDCKEVKE